MTHQTVRARGTAACGLGAAVAWLRSLLRGDAGVSTAQYAIGTIAAAAFASLLYAVVTGESVTGALTSLIERSLQGSF